MPLFDQGLLADPAEGEDFDAQIERAKRAQALIDELRGQKPTQQGRMVGKFYVPPSRMSQIAPAISNIAGTMMQERQAGVDAKRQQAMRTGAEQWMANRPQPTMVEQPGPPTEEGVGPLPKSVPPTANAKMAWAMQGQRNPLTKALAARYGEDQLIQEPIRAEARQDKIDTREDNQQAKREANEANLAFRLEQLKENARQADMRAQDMRLAEKDRAEARREANAIRQQMVDISKDSLEERRQNHLAMVNAKREGQGQKPLTLTDLLKLQTASGKVEDSVRFNGTFDDKYAGVKEGGELKRMSGTYNPFASKGDKAAASWWNDYQNHKNTVRHELFGSALTSVEKGEWEKSDVNPWMEPGQVRENLARRQQLESQAYAKLEAAAGASTRAEQIKAIAPKVDSLPMVTPLPGGRPTAPAAGTSAVPNAVPNVAGVPAGWSVTTKP